VYLNHWPTLFSDRVHIVGQVEKTLAPWNVLYFSQQAAGTLKPVMFHFHGLRVLPGRRARLFRDYDVGSAGLAIYQTYLQSLANSLANLDRAGIEVPFHALPAERFGWIKRLLRRLDGSERFAKIAKSTFSTQAPRHQEKLTSVHTGN
jgi:hypothetical protein